ncbi:MAG TPA: hypothetical protein QF753_08405 [Victivallales bacterium]|jgi:hypothetical protein|nr:hypothetical protein [Victivallales bacterium]
MDDLIKKVFKNDLIDHEKWYQKGLDLIDIAKLLEPKINEYWANNSKRKKLKHFLDCHLMISSFAIENLLKSIIILLNKDEFEKAMSKTHKLPKLLQEHDLSKLLDKTGIAIAEQNSKDLLIRLSRAAIWQGRYPIPLLSNNLPIAGVKSFGEKPFSGKIISINSQSDINDIQNIINNIQNKYNEITSRCS